MEGGGQGTTEGRREDINLGRMAEVEACLIDSYAPFLLGFLITLYIMAFALCPSGTLPLRRGAKEVACIGSGWKAIPRLTS